MTARLVYWNGAMIPESDARLSIYDSALMFGDMVFEMTRSFNKKQFLLEDHLQRLYDSMNRVNITIDLSMGEIQAAVHATIQANEPSFAKDDEHRIMINVSRGILSIYKDVVGVPPGPNVIIADFPLRWTVRGMGRLYDRGINAVIPSQRAIPSQFLDAKIKSRSRLHYMMANIEVSGYEGDRNWALLLDWNGNVTEGTGSNFFIARGRTVKTPRGKHLLRGVSRAYVMKELCPHLDIKCHEDDIDLHDVLTADEAFMTATPFCIIPVTSVNGVSIGDGKVGAITRALLEKWSSNVGIDIVRQIRSWDV